MSTLTLKELSAPTGEVIKIAAGKTLDLKSQGTTTLPTGSVLQVVSARTNTSQTTTSTSYVDTNLSLAITPSSTSSKIHIQFSFSSVTLAAATSGCSFRLMRDSTSLFTPSVGHALYTDANQIYVQYGDTALDSPSTTSSITYKVQVRTFNAASVNVGDTRFINTITLMEIQG